MSYSFQIFTSNSDGPAFPDDILENTPQKHTPLFIYYNWFLYIFLIGVCSEQEAELLPGAVSEINCVSWILIDPQVSLPGCVTQWPQRRRQHQQRQDSAMVIACYVCLHKF